MLILFGLLISVSFVQSDTADRRLFAQVLFRHGARAPSERFTDDAFAAHFPRGLGELTDRGFDNSYLLGKFLRKRYVESGFLDIDLKPRETYWRSVNKNRCLSTAATVGAAMFEDPVRHLHVPVFTEEHGERLLNYDQANCPRETELIREKCPQFNGNYDPWPMYEGFIADCLNYTHPVFTEFPFHTIEAYVNQYKNGLPLPPSLATNLPEVMRMYSQVIQKITGTGVHHDPRMMKLKFGRLVYELLANVYDYGSAFVKYNNGTSRKIKNMPKLKVYSTQDWILMGVLDSLGVLKDTVGLDVYPEYNSMIIIELWEGTNGLYVKVFYKADEETGEDHQLIDVSNKVRHCPSDQEGCPITKFLSCCNDYKTSRPETHCQSSAGSTTKLRKRRYAGPR